MYKLTWMKLLYIIIDNHRMVYSWLELCSRTIIIKFLINPYGDCLEIRSDTVLKKLGCILYRLYRHSRVEDRDLIMEYRTDVDPTLV